MSNGSQIGGVVGAVVGGIIGFYAGGNVAAGAQWGYAIGSAAGAYVDPTKVSGPRLTDAAQQTSTVGIAIPFVYGESTCSGNIIWAADLVEHKKTKRSGKGGGEKVTTYTYTRSYAIGVSETISKYIWIKRNGKLVYAADPGALGAAMGWSIKQVNDLVVASKKFLEKATLYYGTETQMPDSTIVAVEGVGNVSAFRGLAYIVIENEDLTDMQGAVSQYEFCVYRGSAKSYTTPPYPVHVVDSLKVNARPINGILRTWPYNMDAMKVSMQPLGGALRDVVLRHGYIESLNVEMAPVLGELKNVRLIYNNYQPESINVTMQPVAGELKITVLTYRNYLPESLDVTMTPLGGELK